MKLFRKFAPRNFALCAVIALALVAMPVASHAQLILSIGIAPPPLPVYVQPPCPQVGYLWTPGYWAYGPDGYFWVPGTWVQPPTVGVLWTPGYWGWNNGVYAFNQGYWGPTVGFYGGISYGYGYNGDGFYGGRWQGGVFAYNSAVTNIHITNVHVYNETVINHNVRTSFNGPNGISARPTPQQESYMRERHTPPTPLQTQHINGALKEPSLRYATNHGAPAVAATASPGSFKGPGVVKASAPGGKFNPAAAKPASAARPTPCSPQPGPHRQRSRLRVPLPKHVPRPRLVRLPRRVQLPKHGPRQLHIWLPRLRTPLPRRVPLQLRTKRKNSPAQSPETEERSPPERSFLFYN